MKTIVNFHVIPIGLGAYPIILGRPWLRAVSAVQGWRRGTINVHGKTGDKKLFDMDSRKPISGSSEDEDYSSDEESSTIFEVDRDNTSNDENVGVAFLLVEKEIEEVGVVALVDEAKKECVGPFEVIQELM